MCLPVHGGVSAITSRRGAGSQVPKSPRPDPNPQKRCAERAVPPCPGAVGVGLGQNAEKQLFPLSRCRCKPESRAASPAPPPAAAPCPGRRGCTGPGAPRSRGRRGPGWPGVSARCAGAEPAPERHGTARPREAAKASSVLG